jgi:hypothetical protein
VSIVGEPSDQAPRWIAFVVVAAAIVGVILGFWVFAGLT